MAVAERQRSKVAAALANYSALLARIKAPDTAASQAVKLRPPILSQFADEDPEMLKAVDKFVAGLSESKSNLNRAFREKQWEQALQHIHDVKGSGGAFGYPQLSNIARDIDKLLRKKLYQESSILLSDLNDVYDRIIAGRRTG